MVRRKKRLLIFSAGLMGIALCIAGVAIGLLFLLPVKVQFSVDNNIVKTISVDRFNSVDMGEVPNPTIEGYQFDGWYEDSLLETKADFRNKIVEEKTFYAKFSPRNVTVRVFFNDDTNKYYEISTKYNSIRSLYDSRLETSSYLNNYTLIGFRTGLTGNRVYGVDENVTIKNNIFYYALWEGNPQEVSFVASNMEKDGVPFDPTDIEIIPFNGYYTVSLDQFIGVTDASTNLGVKGVKIVGGDGTVYREGERIRINSDTRLELVCYDAEEAVGVEYNNGRPAEVYSVGEEFTLGHPGTKAYHVFKGYFTRNISAEQIPNFVGQFLTVGTTITNATSGMIYYAIWEPIAVEIQFDRNLPGAINTMQPIQTNYLRSVFLTPNAYSAFGYRFIGWAYAPDYTVPDFIDGEVVVVSTMAGHINSGVIKLYAVWEELTTMITFHTNDGDADDTNDTFTKQYRKDAEAAFEAMPSETREHYIFLGWSLDPNCNPSSPGKLYGEPTVNAYMVTDYEAHFYAVWLGKQITIYFDETGSTSGPIDQIETYRMGQNFLVDLRDYEDVKDYTLGTGVKGLKIEGDPTARIYTEGTNILLEGDNVTIVDSSISITLQFSFLAEGEVISVHNNNGEDSPSFYTPGDQPTIILGATPPTREYYNLLGYSKNNISYTQFSIDSNPTRDFAVGATVSGELDQAGVSYYAIWRPVVVTLTFVPTKTVIGGIGRLSVNFGSSVTIGNNELDSSNVYSLIGFKHIGWNLLTGQDTIQYNLIDTVTIDKDLMDTYARDYDNELTPEITKEIEIFAVWVQEIYTLTFNYMGGSGSYVTMDAQEGANISIDLKYFQGITKTHYSFAGWYDNALCEGTNFATSSSPTYIVTPGVHELYAKWNPVNYLVRISLTGLYRNGTYVPSDYTESITYNTNFTVPSGITANLRNIGKYLIKGFKYDGNVYLEGETVLIEGSTTLTPVPYLDSEIVIIENNGSIVNTYLPGTSAYLPGLSLSGYDLDGYEDNLGNLYDVGDSIMGAAAGTRFTAVWVPATITVYFESGSYSWGSISDPASETFEYDPENDWDTLFNLPYGDSTSSEGYPFLGWALYSGTPYAEYYEGQPISYSDIQSYVSSSNEVTFYACWDDAQTYIEVYATTDDGYYSEYIGSYYMTPGQTENISAWISPPDYSYSFSSWYVNNDGTINYYESGDAIYIECIYGSGNVYIEACFTFDSISVTFDVGSGNYVYTDITSRDGITLPSGYELEAYYGCPSGEGVKYDLEIIGWKDYYDGSFLPCGEWYMVPSWTSSAEFTAVWSTPTQCFEVVYDWQYYGYGLKLNDYETLPSGDVIIPQYMEGYQIAYIDTGAFANNSTITSVVIPSSIYAVKKEAFFNCENLTTIEFANPEGSGADIWEIGEFAFAGCRALTTITGSDVLYNMQSIGVGAFADCENIDVNALLESMYNLNSIGAFAFYNCGSVGGDVYISMSIQEIGYNAFRGAGVTIYVASWMDVSGWTEGWNGDCTVVYY